MAIQERFYSAEDLWDISHTPGSGEKRFELIEGGLIEMTPTSGEHGGVAGEAFGRIWNHVRENKLGYITAAETGYILDKDPDSGKDTVLAPDVGFVGAERLPEGLPAKYVPLAPDLAVEVVSPSDTATEVQEKVLTYLKYGTKLVWVLYPKLKSASVHTPGGAYSVDINGSLDGGDVLPGLSIPLAEVFAAVGPIQKQD